MKLKLERTAKAAIALVIVMTAFVGCFGITSNAVGGKMAINIYCNPVLSETSGKFDAFTIEFRGETVDVDGKQATPPSTYWALANFSMDITSAETRKAYPGISGGGCYAGIQRTGKGDMDRTAIMAFWEWPYKGKQIHNAHRLYPEGEDHAFGGEGEGTNWITYYPWKDNEWYRMLIRAWTNPESGTTYVAQWFQEVSTGEWTLISLFDTGLYDSYFKGSMSQFMENFYDAVSDYDRKFNYRNVYVLDHEDKEWKSLDKTNMSCDYTANNKDGTREFGSNDEYFWGITNGTKLDDYQSYNATAQRSGTFSIKQAAAPTFEPIRIENLSAKVVNKRLRVSWNTYGSPIASYKLELFDSDGKKVYEKEASDVTAKRIDISDYETDCVSIKLTATDLFGNTTEVGGVSDKYEDEQMKAQIREFASSPDNFIAASAEDSYDELISDIAAAEKKDYKSGLKGLYGRVCAFKEDSANFISAEKAEDIKSKINDYLSAVEGKKPSSKYEEKAEKVSAKAKDVLERGIKESETEALLADMQDVRDNAFGGSKVWIIIVAAVVLVGAVGAVCIAVSKKKKTKTKTK